MVTTLLSLRHCYHSERCSSWKEATSLLSPRVRNRGRTFDPQKKKVLIPQDVPAFTPPGVPGFSWDWSLQAFLQHGR